MRPHSHFRVDPTNPKARGVCDRCGQHWQLEQLRWQYQWTGPRLQNLYKLVCPPCLDVPQPNIRTIIIPSDPVPVMNARPENYVADDNPLSAVGVSPNFFTPQYGSRIGTLILGGGLNAPFDGVLNKPAWMSACGGISGSSYTGYVGINWTGNVSQLAMPSSLTPPVLRHSLLSVVIQAPSDRGFLDSVATTYLVQSSPVDTTGFGAWTTVASGTTNGSAGETITVTAISPNPVVQFHRVAFLGDGVNYLSVAQVQFNVAQTEASQ